MSRMLYHAPFPLNPQAESASGIRPVCMRRAFEECGYEVIEVTGNARQRREAIAGVRSLCASSPDHGIDFLYSESATIPTMLTEPRHLPPHPLLDPALFAFARTHGIPTGLFYRDIYWAFDAYSQQLGQPLAAVMRLLYRYDLAWYQRYVDRLYLPSLAMGEHIPGIDRSRMAPLPPGAMAPQVDVVGGETFSSSQSPGGETQVSASIRLLYVGGIGPAYDLRECVKAVAGVKEAHLTICTRSGEWEAQRALYAPLMADNIEVVHSSGDELAALYAQADCAVLFLSPDEYRRFASPVKLYEYLGYGKPVIVTAGTHAADLVDATGCGWVLPYEAGALRSLLLRLASAGKNGAELSAAKTRARSEGQRHTWAARAQQVAHELTELGRQRGNASWERGDVP